MKEERIIIVENRITKREDRLLVEGMEWRVED